ncbi:hypothetical protein [Delftia tsuruhatensis]|uniref:hypothetical protein n=1 Tax=Delftia tsuruhatensis TaxID=180282 RepID=UPI0031D9B7A7
MLDVFDGQPAHVRFFVDVAGKVCKRLIERFGIFAIAVALPTPLQASPSQPAGTGPQLYICTLVAGEAGLKELECGAFVGSDMLSQQLGEFRQEGSAKFHARLAVEHVSRLDMSKNGGKASAQDHEQNVAQARNGFNDHKNTLDVFWLLLGAFIGLFALHTGLVDELSRWFYERLDSLIEWLKK